MEVCQWLLLKRMWHFDVSNLLFIRIDARVLLRVGGSECVCLQRRPPVGSELRAASRAACHPFLALHVSSLCLCVSVSLPCLREKHFSSLGSLPVLGPFPSALGPPASRAGRREEALRGGRRGGEGPSSSWLFGCWLRALGAGQALGPFPPAYYFLVHNAFPRVYFAP